mgnify:CR=1 FL=1
MKADVPSRPAAFLDRDGTLIEERGYPTSPKDIVPLPGVAESLSILRGAGYLCIVLTNQSAIARGFLTEEALQKIHEDLTRKLSTSQGPGIDAIYYCPHLEEGTSEAYSFACKCRKPKAGLLEQAMSDLPINLAESCFIGDSPRDLFPSAENSATRILVSSGHPIEDASTADHVASNLQEAVAWFLARPNAP